MIYGMISLNYGKRKVCKDQIYCVNSNIPIHSHLLQIKNIDTNKFTHKGIFPLLGDIQKTIESLVGQKREWQPYY